MSEVKVSNQTRFTGGAPNDAKLTPVATKSDLDKMPILQRYLGMTILVKDEKVEYWLKDNVSTWVKKTMQAESIDCGEY